TGLAILLHLQNGLTLALVTSPLYFVKLRDFGAVQGAVATWGAREEREMKKPGRYPSLYLTEAPLRANHVKVSKTAFLAALLLLPASPALWHVGHMLKCGLAKSSVSSAFYIDFRHPHHFELLSVTAAVWVTAHLTVIVLAYWFFRHRDANASRAIGKLL